MYYPGILLFIGSCSTTRVRPPHGEGLTYDSPYPTPYGILFHESWGALLPEPYRPYGHTQPDALPPVERGSPTQFGSYRAATWLDPGPDLYMSRIKKLKESLQVMLRTVQDSIGILSAFKEPSEKSLPLVNLLKITLESKGFVQPT